jgi:hypothetical protein
MALAKQRKTAAELAVKVAAARGATRLVEAFTDKVAALADGNTGGYDPADLDALRGVLAGQGLHLYATGSGIKIGTEQQMYAEVSADPPADGRDAP